MNSWQCWHAKMCWYDLGLYPREYVGMAVFHAELFIRILLTFYANQWHVEHIEQNVACIQINSYFCAQHPHANAFIIASSQAQVEG